MNKLMKACNIIYGIHPGILSTTFYKTGQLSYEFEVIRNFLATVLNKKVCDVTVAVVVLLLAKKLFLAPPVSLRYILCSLGSVNPFRFSAFGDEIKCLQKSNIISVDYGKRKTSPRLPLTLELKDHVVDAFVNFNKKELVYPRVHTTNECQNLTTHNVLWKINLFILEIEFTMFNRDLFESLLGYCKHYNNCILINRLLKADISDINKTAMTVVLVNYIKTGELIHDIAECCFFLFGIEDDSYQNYFEQSQVRELFDSGWAIPVEGGYGVGKANKIKLSPKTVMLTQLNVLTYN